MNQGQEPEVGEPLDRYQGLGSFVSEAVRTAISKVPLEYFELTEKELRGKAKPTPTDYALRVSFWREFEKVMLNGGQGVITNSKIFFGICHETQFYTRFLKLPAKVAWLVKPMQTYQKECEAVLARGTERLWELVELPIYNKKGLPDAKLAEIVLKTIKSIEDRVQGMAVQRQQRVQVNVGADSSPAALKGTESMDAIDARIKDLERQLKLGGQPTRTDAPALPSANQELFVLGLQHPDTVEGEMVGAVPDEDRPLEGSPGHAQGGTP